ncbi:transcriptional activator spt7 [Coccidioides immitis H538.4]|uniref:Transcriptional activator spt7 n=1 Tax=Coccidioides immitis H538.4 TaxID=396776 RepID=A0A0J8RMM8_COCIT|nr:transcriptional activator spt7 [Coccidioides immitis H538.4]
MPLTLCADLTTEDLFQRVLSTASNSPALAVISTKGVSLLAIENSAHPSVFASDPAPSGYHGLGSILCDFSATQESRLFSAEVGSSAEGNPLARPAAGGFGAAMSLNQHCAWLPPGHLRPPDNQHNAISSANGLSNGPSRPRTPQIPSRANAESSQSGNLILDGDGTPEEDPRVIAFRESYKRTEAKINLLFSNKRVLDVSASVTEPNGAPAEDHAPADSQTEAALVPSRRPGPETR